MGRLYLVLVVALFACAQAGVMYGTNANVQLVKVNEGTSAQTIVGGGVDVYQIQALGAIDSINGVYYLLVDNNTVSDVMTLIGLDIKTGNVMYTVPLPQLQIPSSVGIGSGNNIDVVTNGDVIVTGHQGQTNPDTHLVLKVTPRTGVVQKFASFQSYDLVSACSAFDAKYGIEWVQQLNDDGSQPFLGFDIHTGALKYSVPNNYSVGTLHFDRVSGLTYGLGFDSNFIYRILVALDGRDGTWKVIGNVSDYFQTTASFMSAIDTIGRRLYAVMAPQDDTKPWSLVGIDLRTGKIVSQPVACSAADFSECPWTLAYDDQ